MKAALFRGIGQIEVAEVPRPEPGPGEVLIRVGYCGICGSDLEAYHVGMYEPGLVPGHEFAGTLAELGAGVAGWQVGDRVVIDNVVPCGGCPPCREGRPDACECLATIGVTHDGALAEYCLAPARALHRLPGGMTLRQGALVEPLSFAAECGEGAGIVLGTKNPVVLTSRADSIRTRLASVAVMTQVALARRSGKYETR
mgnify:CR=1 FL=1